jgi:Sec-independent protein translocase protein TatA
MISYFLLLANAVLIDIKSFENGKTFDATLAEFKRYMRENKNTQMKKQAVDPIKKLFDKESPEMQKRFQPIKELISTH